MATAQHPVELVEGHVRMDDEVGGRVTAADDPEISDAEYGKITLKQQ